MSTVKAEEDSSRLAVHEQVKEEKWINEEMRKDGWILRLTVENISKPV